jgi:hypothetical protein
VLLHTMVTKGTRPGQHMCRAGSASSTHSYGPPTTLSYVLTAMALLLQSLRLPKVTTALRSARLCRPQPMGPWALVQPASSCLAQC